MFACSIRRGLANTALLLLGCVATCRGQEPGAKAADEQPAIETLVESYPNGNKKIERQVTRDEKGRPVNHGSWSRWHENGQLAEQGKFEQALALFDLVDFEKQTGFWLHEMLLAKAGALSAAGRQDQASKLLRKLLDDPAASEAHRERARAAP